MKIQSLVPFAWRHDSFVFDQDAALPTMISGTEAQSPRKFSPLLSHTETQSLFNEAFHALAHEMAGGSAHDVEQEEPQC